jgi:hypothetical protein
VHRQAPGLGFRSDSHGVGVRAHSRNNDGSCLGEQDGQLATDTLRRPDNDDDAIAEIEAPRHRAKRRGMIFAIGNSLCPSEIQTSAAHAGPFS